MSGDLAPSRSWGPRRLGISTVLGSMGDDRLGGLLAQARRQRYAMGASIFREGSPSGSVLVLEHGRVKVTSLTEDGHEALLAIRGPGDVLGELGALDGCPRSATVSALEEVVALVISAASFRSEVERDGRLALRLLRTVNGRLRDADRKRVEFGALDTPRRVALRLLELAGRYGNPARQGTHITLPLTQEELAGWVGASREGVAKALRTFRERGWIETGRRRLTIRDRDALQRFASGED